MLSWIIKKQFSFENYSFGHYIMNFNRALRSASAHRNRKRETRREPSDDVTNLMFNEGINDVSN